MNDRRTLSLFKTLCIVGLSLLLLRANYRTADAVKLANEWRDVAYLHTANTTNCLAEAKRAQGFVMELLAQRNALVEQQDSLIRIIYRKFGTNAFEERE